MKIIKEWRKRDWLWTVFILLGIIVIILTWRLNYNDNVVNMISMLSAGASIILAITAIIQSTIYNSSSNELNIKMTEKLSAIEINMELVKDNIFRVVDKAPIEKGEKEELKRRMECNVKFGIENTAKGSITVVNKKSDIVLNLNFEKLMNILENSKGNKVRYREDGIPNFTNDILKGYNKLNDSNIVIELKNKSIVNDNITDISFANYDDRIDVWIYGDKTNRFNIDIN